MVEHKVNWGGLCCTRPITDPHSLPYEEQKLHFPHLYKETTQRLLMPCKFHFLPLKRG